MTKEQFEKFCSFRDEFRNQILLWNKKYNVILKEKIEELEGYEITDSFIYNKTINKMLKK